MKWITVLMQPWLAPLMRQRGLCRGLLAAVLVLGVGMVLGKGWWGCVFAEVTGLPCPGCGLSRALLALARGEWALAWRLHPLAPGFVGVGLAVVWAAVMPAGWVSAGAERVEAMERRTKLTALFLMALIAFGLLRLGGFWYPLEIAGSKSALLKRVMEAR